MHCHLRTEWMRCHIRWVHGTQHGYLHLLGAFCEGYSAMSSVAISYGGDAARSHMREPVKPQGY